MTPSERETVLQHLAAGRDRLHAAAAALDASAWLRRPSPGAWSPCLCVEHIVLVETAVLDTLNRALSAPEPAPASLRALTEGKDAIVLRAVPNRSRKVLAPEPMAPPGLLAPEHALAHFDTARARTIAFAASAPSPVRHAVWRHPYLKELDGYQWLLFIAAHGLRHTIQLEEAAAAQA